MSQNRWVRASFSFLVIFASQNSIAEGVLVFRPKNTAFTTAESSLKKYMPSMKFYTYETSGDIEYSAAKVLVEKKAPEVVVFMDNPSARLANRLIKEAQTPDGKPITGLVMMSLKVDKLVSPLANLATIKYEIPAFSLFRSYNTVMKKRLSRPVVFYRKSIDQEYVETSIKQLKLMNIHLTAVDVEQNAKNPEALFSLVGKTLQTGDFDSVFVLLDSVLLSQENFRKVWHKTANSSKLPFLAGAEKLAEPYLNFCTFAVAPDLDSMAQQASESIMAMLTRPENVSLKPQPIVGVKRFLNFAKMKQLKLKMHSSPPDVEILKQ